MVTETKAKHKCPPHHFFIDCNDVGVCRRCGEVRDFRKLQRRAEQAMELKAELGRRGRPRKSEPKLNKVLL